MYGLKPVPFTETSFSVAYEAVPFQDQVVKQLVALFLDGAGKVRT